MVNSNYKLILVGDSGVGKSTYIKRLLKCNFNSDHVPTLGVEVYSLNVTNNNKTITLDVWDTAGNENFRGLYSGYFLKADCAIIMLSGAETELASLYKYIKDIKKYCGEIPIAIICNKSDLESTHVNYKKIQRFNLSHKIFLCSTKTDFDIQKPINQLIDELEIQNNKTISNVNGYLYENENIKLCLVFIFGIWLGCFGYYLIKLLSDDDLHGIAYTI